MKNIKSMNQENKFIFITSILSFIISILYLYKGIIEGITYKTYIVVSLNFLYIPISILLKKKVFSIYYVIYSITLIFIAAFNKTYLYNNFTYLFIICILTLVIPKLKNYFYIIYFTAITIAYILNEEELYHYLIHITRGIWFTYIFENVIESKYKRKKLILYDDEIKILTQLSKNHLQKSIQFQGYSESTIYRRLKAAMKRNNFTKQELLESFKKEYSELLND